jgi:hypothetical protein
MRNSCLDVLQVYSKDLILLTRRVQSTDTCLGVWGKVWGERKGILELHAYSVMRAVEIDNKRLLLLKNPWGKGEWKGPWSESHPEIPFPLVYSQT